MKLILALLIFCCGCELIVNYMWGERPKAEANDEQ